MFLSIVLPINNVSPYLEECLSSCFAQDIPASDYELVCVNDGSTDNCPEILQRLSETHPNMIVINQANGGLSHARNVGMAAARGDYIWFVDSDDVIRENCLARFRDIVYSQGLDRLSFRYYPFSSADSVEERNSWFQDPNHKTGIGYDTMVWPNLFRADFLARENARFDTNITYAEDTLFLFQLLLTKPKQLHISEAFVFWRQRSGSITKQNSEKRKLAMIRSLYYASSYVRQTYVLYANKDLQTRQYISDMALMLELKALEQHAQLEQPAFSQMLRELREQGKYPIKNLPDVTYSVRECAREPSGLGAFRNILQYYSIHPWGLYLSALPYWTQRLKIKTSRRMRKNPVLNKLLDLKNRILRRKNYTDN